MLELSTSFSSSRHSITQIEQRRNQRLLQIIGLTFLALLISSLVSAGGTQKLLLLGCASLGIAALFAFKKHTILSIWLTLWAMTLMLSGLAYLAGGLRDLSLLGYPGVLIFSALLGGMRLFSALLVFILLYCGLLAWLTINNMLQPVIPILGWHHLLYILIIMLVTSFSIYLMLKDLYQLMYALQQENNRVQDSHHQIEQLAHHDSLTELPNRIMSEQLYNEHLQYCRQHKQQLALLFLDLDNFKPVNDSLGHSAGDILLKELAARLKSILPAPAIVCRFGGDEFLFLVPISQHNQVHLSQLASQILQQIASPFHIMQTEVDISGSLGIAIAPTDGMEFSILCRKADLAMYQAKSDGRNTFRFYDKHLDQANVDKFNLLQQLRHALKEQQFQLHYQPKLCLKSGKITGVEALLRWPQPDGSYISPTEFIPLAESSGLINEIGAWVIQQACKDCQFWRRHGHRQLTVAINLSPIQFRDGKLEQRIQQALKQYDLPPATLELELTESLLIGEADNIQQQLNRLNALGLAFAIDDFGTGYSNLGYLRRFNATTLKIDRSFIVSLCLSERDEPLVHAIIQMAKSLRLKTVAEGIEDIAIVERLKHLGCDEGQGFYWSAALPATELLAMLGHNNTERVSLNNDI